MGKEKKSEEESQATGTFSQAIDRLIHDEALPTRFADSVVREARALPGGITDDERGRRVDLRGESTVTIDGETARDFDDAVSIRRLDGGFRLLVSIADVSHFVRPGSALDREALHRGTSTYFPDRVIPMLPERLSNDLCSLVPGEDRLAFTAELHFDRQGKVERSQFFRSVIRSRVRLTYTLVKEILVDRDPDSCDRYASLVPDLVVMEELMDLLMSRRLARGSLDFDLPEPEILLDLEEGSVDGIIRAARNKAHRLIEEFMIAANEAVAEFLTDRKRPMIYRVHGQPEREKIRDFAQTLHNLGVPVRLGDRPQPKDFVKVLAAVRGQPNERMVNTLLLRSLGRAVYQTDNVGHFGLASRCYTHFTSPIRRYPDLVVHRLLAETLAGEKGQDSRALKRVALRSTETERGAMKMEWAVRDLAAAWFMRDRIREHHRGIISNVTRFGFFVELETYFLEGLVSVRALSDDFYRFSEKTHQLIGRKNKKRFRIGDRVTVEVKGVNLEKRWVDLALVALDASP